MAKAKKTKSAKSSKSESKLPKEIRKQADKFVELARHPMVADIVSAGLAALAASVGKSGTKSKPTGKASDFGQSARVLATALAAKAAERVTNRLFDAQPAPKTAPTPASPAKKPAARKPAAKAATPATASKAAPAATKTAAPPAKRSVGRPRKDATPAKAAPAKAAASKPTASASTTKAKAVKPAARTPATKPRATTRRPASKPAS